MAEFVRVMKEKKRMCEMLPTCANCHIYRLMSEQTCLQWIPQHLEEAEHIIMQWAAENPIKTNRMRFEEVFGCGIVTHEVHEAIPGHVKILNASDEEFEEWLNAEYKGAQDGAV